jgi:hypothetical protein
MKYWKSRLVIAVTLTLILYLCACFVQWDVITFTNPEHWTAARLIILLVIAQQIELKS